MSWNELTDVARGFWPLALTYVTVPLSIYLHIAWIGAILLLFVLLLPRLWWSYIFGLMNWITLVVGILLCSIATIRYYL